MREHCGGELHMTMREQIIKSHAAARMLRMVSPIYDESYVMCWIFEAIGREIDLFNAYTSELKNQTASNNTTWTIENWEKEFGIMPVPSASLEERQSYIIFKQSSRQPMNPARIERIVKRITGLDARVVEQTGTYVFDVYISAYDDDLVRRVRAEINRIKPAHLDFNLINLAEHETMMYAAAYILRKKRMVVKEVLR